MRVLIVEDNEELREAIARYLRAEGHAVDELSDASGLRAFLDADLVDVVILDRMLPSGDGLHALAAARREGQRTPALILSSKDTVEDRVEGLEGGADDYLVKPFAMEELTARLRSLSRRRELPRAHVAKIGELSIDYGRRRVYRKDVLIPLRAKEFSLLELLASAPGQVVSKEQIINWCWDVQHQPSSNVEEVLVAGLRRKLGKPSPIRTLRGVGYSLEP